MLYVMNETKVYTGIVIPFSHESDVLIAIKSSSGKLYAKLGKGVGINPFNHYFARVSVVKVNGQNIAVAIDYIAENLDKSLLKTLLAHVPKRSEKYLDELLRQLMCISDPLFRHFFLGVLCDNATYPLLLSSVSINDHNQSLFESTVERTSVVIEKLKAVDIQDLERDSLITVSLLRGIANNEVLKKNIYKYYTYGSSVLDVSAAKFIGLKHCVIASLVMQHMEIFTTDFDFIFYIEQVIEVCEEGLPVFSVLDLLR